MASVKALFIVLVVLILSMIVSSYLWNTISEPKIYLGCRIYSLLVIPALPIPCYLYIYLGLRNYYNSVIQSNA